MKRNLTAGIVIILCVILPLIGALGQTPSNAQQDQQAVRIGAVEIPLDIVVRDKKGRPVRDLTANDFEIYEDGVRQRIESFRLVSRDGQRTDSTKKPGEVIVDASGTKPDPTTSVNVTALLFDGLTPDSRSLAHKAASAYAQESVSAQNYTGVFAIDLSLRTLQTYTNNTKLVSAAVDKISTFSTSTYASNAETIRTTTDQSAALAASTQQALSGLGATPGGGGSSDTATMGQGMMQQAFNDMEVYMKESFDSLERDQQGHVTVNALLAVIESMRSLPGRKTIVFFSEGVAIPVAVQAQFNSVISAANRSNISIYTIDAQGLRIDSPYAETTKELNSQAQRRMQQAGTSRDPSTGPMMKQLEHNEDVLRLNPHAGLGQLADQTGGLFIKDTNDLTTGIRRIDEDSHLHYMVTYAPKNQELDGRFRKIEVKLTRPNMEVQARKGYYAFNATSGSTVLEYEVPMLAAIGKTSSNPLGLNVLAMNFPGAKRSGLSPVIAEVPMSGFTFTPDNDKKTYSTNFSILTLIKDESKQVVQKLSQNYALSGPLDKLAVAKKDSVLFYRETDLAPGRYTLETIAYDAPSGKASARSTTLEVSAADDTKLRLSSLAILKRADRLTAQEIKVDNPFHIGEVIVYPNLGEPLHKAALKQLAFFFTAWPAKGSTDKLNATIELSQGGKSLGQIPVELPTADEKGRVQYASALPIDNFKTGSYELKVTVKDSRGSTSRTIQFNLEQ